MDFSRVLDELRSERQKLDEAILVMERLAAGSRGKRRGRPPKWVSALTAERSGPAKKRSFSAAARKRIAQAQKKRWAAIRAKSKKTPTA